MPAPAPVAAERAKPGISNYMEQYQPVLVIAGASIIGGIAVAFSGAGTAERVMQGAMGLFLFQLALLKLIDIAGFAAAFARYDIVAKRWRPYGNVYPFAELGLALLYLSAFYPALTYALTLAIMGVGAIGVVQTLARGEQVKCACVGSKIDVPLGSLSILENVGMAAMAALMLAL